MQDLEKLAGMDLKEVSRKTHITESKLKEIINKDFEALHPIRAKGFIGILERELGLDLQEWTKDYDKYYKYRREAAAAAITESKTIQDSDQSSHQSIETPPKSPLQELELDTTKPKDDSPKDAAKPTPTKPGYESKATPDTKPLDSQAVLQIEEKAAPKAPKTSPSTQSEGGTSGLKNKKLIALALGVILGLCFLISSIYSMLSPDHHDDLPIKPSEESSRMEPPAQASQDEEQVQNQEEDKQEDEKELDSKPMESKSDSKEEVGATLITITPQKEVWFSWIDLETKKRGEKYARGEFSLELEGKGIFHFGNLLLDIRVGGKEYNFNKAGVGYIAYDPESGPREISQREFNAMKRLAK